MATIADFADITLAYAGVNGLPFTHLQLQKVLYYLQGWSAGYCDEPLFAEEPQAWINGPVYPSVWQVYKSYGGSEISNYGEITEEEFEQKFIALSLDENQASVVKSVLEKYAAASASWLVQKTHSEQPWLDARQNLGPFEASTNTIPLASIQTFFRSKITQAM